MWESKRISGPHFLWMQDNLLAVVEDGNDNGRSHHIPTDTNLHGSRRESEQSHRGRTSLGPSMGAIDNAAWARWQERNSRLKKGSSTSVEILLPRIIQMMSITFRGEIFKKSPQSRREREAIPIWEAHILDFFSAQEVGRPGMKNSHSPERQSHRQDHNDGLA